MSRQHFYTYTVSVRTVAQLDILDKNGKPTGHTEEGIAWIKKEVSHCGNIHDVAGKLHLNLDDIRYEHKEME